MSGLPWFKMFPEAWRSDPSLRSCSSAARGLWMDMLCLMHEANPRGHLCLSTGQMVDVPALARLCNLSLTETRKLVAELRKAGVFSVTDSGVIFSRRMARDERRSQRGRETGRLGGNPALRGDVIPIRAGRTCTQPLRGEDNPYYPLSSPRKVSTYQGKALGQEEALGDEGPFTGGEAA